jgi:cyanophycin synthetase
MDNLQKTSIAILPKPDWRLRPGYAYDIPQSSMTTFQSFPGCSSSAQTTSSFTGLVERIIETEVTSLQWDSPVSSDLETAIALAQATSHVQRFVYIPVVTDYRAEVVSVSKLEKKVRLILPWWRPDATKTAYAFCVGLWNRLSAGEVFQDIDALRSDLNEILKPFVSPSVNEFALVTGLKELDINLVRLPGNILCLGTGERSRLMDSTTSDATSVIGVKVARNKFQTSSILRLSGLPGSINALVKNADDAVATADQFEYPVVVKPADLDQGKGVAADLRGSPEVRAAYLAAREISENVLVEKFIPGFTHRLTVAEGEVISVRQRLPGGVTGDGKSTITELVAAHSDSAYAKRWARQRGRPPVILDEEALTLLQQEQLSPQTILPNGKFQRLRRRDNINAGGENRDLALSDVHPDNLTLAVEAARALRLNIAGIDLITEDITKSWRDVDAAICEVNGRPQMASRKTPEMFWEIIKRIVGPNPHVPAQLILCADDPSERKLIINAVKRQSPDMTISARDGLLRNGEALTGPFKSGWNAAIAAITRTDTRALLSIMSMEEVLSSGSPIRHWNKIQIRQGNMSAAELKLIPAVRTVLNATKAEPTNKWTKS